MSTTPQTSKRTFKIKTDSGEYYSRILGNTPKQAALKALSIIHNNYEKGKFKDSFKVEGEKTPTFKFCIKETTRFSQQKEYNYVGKRVELENPASYTIKAGDGTMKTITNRYKNMVEKFKE